MRNQLQHERIARLLAEIERKQGPIDPRVMADVRREWPGPRTHPGVGAAPRPRRFKR